jgi:predicted peptidase
LIHSSKSTSGKTRKHARILVIVALLSCVFYLQISEEVSRFTYNKYLNGKGDTLKYRLCFPDYDPLRKFPLVIFLHGSGECGNDNELQLKWGVLNFATDEAMMIHPGFTLLPEMGHFSWLAAYNDRVMIEWLFRQSKK